MLEIWMVNRLATYGEQLSKLEEIKGKLLTENELLENEIAAKSSLSHLGEQARSEGFVPIRNIEVIGASDSAEVNRGNPSTRSGL